MAEMTKREKVKQKGSKRWESQLADSPLDNGGVFFVVFVFSIIALNANDYKEIMRQ